MNPFLENLRLSTRRHFLKQSTAGIGAAALAAMTQEEASGASVEDPLAVRQPHFKAKAKRVIYLHMTGSPPNLDLFDYKPELLDRSDQDCPDQFLAGREFAFTSGCAQVDGFTPKVETGR